MSPIALRSAPAVLPLVATLLLALAGSVAAAASAPPQACGGAWALVPTPAPGPSSHQVRGVTGLSNGEAWVVGSYFVPSVGDLVPLALRRTAGVWTNVPTPVLPAGIVMKAVDALAHDDVWAVGGHGIPYAFHFDGAAWSAQKLPKPGAFEAGIHVEDVVALAPDDVWAVGFYDHTLTAHLRTAVWHFDGSAWAVVPSPSIPNTSGAFYPSMLLSVSAAGPGALVAVGEWRIGNQWFPLAMRWNGAAWSLMAPPVSQHGDGRLRSVSARSPDDVWAVGTADDDTPIIGGGYARAFALHWDGRAWSEIAVAQPSALGINPLRTVLADEDGVLVAGCWQNATQGLDTLIARFDGTAFELVDSVDVPGNGQGWNQLAGLASVGGEPWAVGDGNAAFGTPTKPLVQRLADPCAGSVSQVGSGTSGCGGAATAAASSVPALGNAAFSVTFAGLPPSSPAFVLLGTAAHAAGWTLAGLDVLVHLDPFASSFLLVFELASAGEGALTLPLPVPSDPALAGQPVVLQAFAPWPAASCGTALPIWSSSPALALTVHP